MSIHLTFQFRIVLAVYKIDNINIEINSSQTKHSLLDKIMAVFLQQRIKHEISLAVEDYINDNVEAINQQINQFFGENPWESVRQKATSQLLETFKF